MDSVRAMLDELMGKDRNVPLQQRSEKTIRWDDPSVCKYQLCGLCPSRLFKNTKSDLGPCEYEIHDDHLDWPTIKEAFDKADPRDVERYERKLLRFLEDLIREMDRKIAKNKDRAEKESAPRELLPADKDRLADLKARAKEALEKAERLAEEGEVDGAHQLQMQAEAYNRQHEELHRRLTIPDKTMLVCDICGVFINSTDNEARRREGLPPQLILDHLEGKQYLGWKAIRDRHAELVAKYGPGGPGAAGAMGGVAAARGGSMEPRERGGLPSTSDRDRERDRDRGGADRERERERDDRRGDDRRRGGDDYRREDRSGSRDYDRSRDRDYDRSSRGRDYDGSRSSRDDRGRDNYSRGHDSRDYRGSREGERRRY